MTTVVEQVAKALEDFRWKSRETQELTGITTTWDDNARIAIGVVVKAIKESLMNPPHPDYWPDGSEQTIERIAEFLKEEGPRP